MDHSKKILFSLVFFIFLIGLTGPEKARGFSDEELLNWVTDQLKVTEDFPIPVINIVPQKELQGVFKKNNKESFKRWAEEYGQADANKILDKYLKEVAGLFNPKTKIIHVKQFEDTCREGSIVAHELAHYLQIMENDTNGSPFPDTDELRFFREMQAGHIETVFMESFCGRPAGD